MATTTVTEEQMKHPRPHLKKVIEQATEALIRGLTGLLQVHSDLQVLRWRLAELEEHDEPVPVKARQPRRRSASIGPRQRRSVKRT